MARLPTTEAIFPQPPGPWACIAALCSASSPNTRRALDGRANAVKSRISRGALLVNLGTPSAPTPEAVRAYLAEFLSDPRVVRLPRLVWAPILHGFVLRTRPARSAEKYASIWSAEGSPLAVHTRRQSEALGRALPDVKIEYAMRYGAPDIPGALAAAGLRRHGGAAVSAVLREHHRKRGRQAAGGNADDPRLPRPRGLHRGAGGERAPPLGDGRPRRGARHELPRPARARRGLLRARMPRHGNAARRRAGAEGRAVEGHVPVALRQREMAAALHRGDADRTRAARRRTRRRGVPRLRLGLPRDARGDRHRGAPALPRGRRTRALPAALPERIPGVDRRAGAHRPSSPLRRSFTWSSILPRFFSIASLAWPPTFDLARSRTR